MKKCYNAVTYTAKLYNHTNPDKGSQVHMANSYNLYKVESFKAERYTLQSLHPMTDIDETDISITPANCNGQNLKLPQ